MADGAGGMAVDGGSPRLTLSSLAVLAFHGGGAGVRGAGDGGDILLDSTVLDSTATAPNTVTTARMAMAPNTVTTARIAMEIPATVMGMATDLATAIMAMEILDTDLATAMQANTAPPLDRG